MNHPQSGLLQGANCRLLAPHQQPTPTPSRGPTTKRPQEPTMESLEPALSSAQEPIVDSDWELIRESPQELTPNLPQMPIVKSREPTSESSQEPTMDSTQELITESPQELTPTPTQENKDFFSQLQTRDMPTQELITESPQELTLTPAQENKYFFSQLQTQDMPANLDLPRQTRQEEDVEDEPQEPTSNSPQGNPASTSQQQAEQNEGLGQNRQELYEAEELQNPTLRRLLASVNTWHDQPLRQATAQQMRLLDVQMQRLAEVEQSSRRFREEAPAVQAEPTQLHRNQEGLYEVEEPQELEINSPQGKMPASTSHQQTEQNAPPLQEEVPTIQADREQLRQLRQELYEPEEPQDPTNPRRRPRYLNTGEAEILRQNITHQIPLLGLRMERLTDEIARLREFQQGPAARVARLLTAEERAQGLEKARRHLGVLRRDAVGLRQVVRALTGLVIAGLIVSLMVKICLAAFYLCAE